MVHSEQTAVSVLKNFWGHASFRPGQWEVIRNVLAKKDVLGVLPTGSGKSICFQLPGLLMEGSVVVVSPLIALMSDQVANLKVRGIEAVALNSSIPRSQQPGLWRDTLRERYKFIYVSPELLHTDRFRSVLDNIHVSLVAVDEAHCIAEWGRQFRPSFRRIANAVPKGATRIAVTATANPTVQRDIVRTLKLRAPEIIVTGYDRSNLFWSAAKVKSVVPSVERLIGDCPDSTVVYCMTRRAVEWWADWFSIRAIPTSFYHGGLERTKRDQSQTDWLCGRTRVMVATNAFGMGIDKANVRLVLHIGLPSNLSSYYQEAGRAGRDGAPARASLFYQNADVLVRRRLLSSSARRMFRNGFGQGIRQFAEFLRYLEAPICRRRYILNYFGEAYKGDCGRCDQCVNDIPEHPDGELSHSHPHKALLQHLSTSTAPNLNRLVKEGLVEYTDDLSSTRLTRLGKSRLLPTDHSRKLRQLE